jgi:hypothetical protein
VRKVIHDILLKKGRARVNSSTSLGRKEDITEYILRVFDERENLNFQEY